MHAAAISFVSLSDQVVVSFGGAIFEDLGSSVSFVFVFQFRDIKLAVLFNIVVRFRDIRITNNVSCVSMTLDRTGLARTD